MGGDAMSSRCSHKVGRQEPNVGVAEIFRRYFDAYLLTHKVSYYQRKVVDAIQSCRTAALGGHVIRCNKCDYQRHEYDSCRNRHCPQCQIYQKLKWVAARLGELLPIPYYHTVFTMPHSLNALALYNKELIYDMFFKATSQALNAFAQDPRFLGAKLGFIGILHTWGQALTHHIHIHYIVTGGGLSNDGQRWVKLPYGKKFLFPAKAVSCRVRRQFSKLLWQAYREDKLIFPDELAYLKEPSEFDRFLNKVAWEEWRSHMKEPFGGPDAVVKYIGRYTHRVAISDHRIKAMNDGRVVFAYKKYHNDTVSPGTMTLDYDEFIRRFLLHVIPHGFKRIRHFGFLSSGSKTRALQCLRNLLIAASEKLKEAQATFEAWLAGADNRMKCPECKDGLLQVCEWIAPVGLVPG
jgi:hypothetical protein